MLSIKREGYKALLQLAERIELLLACDVRETLDNDLKYTDIEDMLEKLTIYHKREELQSGLQNTYSVADECLNINQYISLYSNKQPFKSVYNQRSKLTGKGIEKLFKERSLYSYDVNAYYKGIEEYLEHIEGDVTRDMNIQGFVKLFMSICNVKSDPELASITYQQIEDLIRKYLVASAIDVDTSLLETDFAITMNKPDVDQTALTNVV